MKTLLAALILAVGFQAQAGDVDGQVTEVTRDLTSVTCHSIYEGKYTERVSGQKTSVQKPLILKVNYFDQAGVNKTGLFKVQDALMIIEADETRITINAKGRDGQVTMSVVYGSETEIWVNGVRQDYLKLICQTVLAN